MSEAMRKRWYHLPGNQKVTLADLLSWCMKEDVRPEDAEISGGVVTYLSAESPEERGRRERFEEEKRLKTEDWERGTYARLKEKFESPAVSS